ncbi:hypothetical protein GCM10008933_24080 [Paenibacillus motobuensis]|uniref:N-acetyltransferase domain-containing protein n=2 Tax=Paenibacillus motobuensis TaxID=295324 RepID=A0ABN0YE11_9BACL
MIRLCRDEDIERMHRIINDAASAYRGIIPDDRYHEPYMELNELKSEIQAGVVFWGYEHQDELIGVMGIQDKGDVSLIRHAYVLTKLRQKGIGSQLLAHLIELTDKPILIGTWEAAEWAIRFYKKSGFELVTSEEKQRLLKKYWDIPERQIETSVVLSSKL